MSAQTKRIYEFGPFRLDAAERVLLRDGRPEPITPKAFDVLLMLVESSGHIVEKDELMNRVWSDSFVEEGNLKATVSVLRKTLEQSAGEHQYIETVPRRGYRFTADVRALVDAGPELMLLERSRADVIIEEGEEGVGQLGPPQTAGVLRAAPGTESLLAAIKRHKRASAVALVAMLVVTAGAGYGLYRFLAGKSNQHFQTMKLKGLTSSGAVLEASISPDGKYVAYSVDEGGQESLWLRQVDVGASNTQIASADNVRYQAATFSPDGNYVYYVKSDNSSDVLFRTAVLGGASRKMMEGVARPISFSPDGKQFAFLRRNDPNRDFSLLIANADGSGETKLATGSLGPPAWSPDGKIIACGSIDRDVVPPAGVMGVRIVDHQQRLIGPRRFWSIGQVAWLENSSLIVAGQDGFATSQLWQISYPGGELRRITNDLNDYRGVSLTANYDTIATVQSEEFCTLWVAPNGDAARAKQITPGLGRQDLAGGLCWTPDGKLVYESSEGGEPGIWITTAEGTERKQLSDDSYLASRPMVSPDGRYVVFISAQSGYPNVWRMNIDGSNLKRLTDSTFEGMPSCSADSQSVIYTSLVSGVNLWRVPIDGGEPARLTRTWARGAVISPDGKRMVCWYRGERQQNAQLTIAIIPFEGGDPVKVFHVDRSAHPPSPAPNYLRWTLDGKAVLYIDTRDGVSNIWSQPADGRPPAKITEFTSDRIFSFDWSKDGKLALARGRQTSDIVVITDFK